MRVPEMAFYVYECVGGHPTGAPLFRTSDVRLARDHCRDLSCQESEYESGETAEMHVVGLVQGDLIPVARFKGGRPCLPGVEIPPPIEGWPKLHDFGFRGAKNVAFQISSAEHVINDKG